MASAKGKEKKDRTNRCSFLPCLPRRWAHLKIGRVVPSVAPSEYDAFKASPAYNEWVAQEHTEVFLETHRDIINANIDALQKGIDLVGVCGDMTRTEEQKKELDVFLKHEMVLQNLPSAVERIPMLLAVKEANEKLKAACEARNEELKKVREATDAVSVYLEGAGGSAAMEVRVNQWRQEKAFLDVVGYGDDPAVDVQLTWSCWRRRGPYPY